MDYKLFDKLFDDRFYNLDTMIRFQGRHMNIKESVAHHTCWVVHYAHEVGCLLGFSIEELYRVMLCAEYHDFDEIISYDVNFNLKYNDYNGHHIREDIDAYVSSVLVKNNVGRLVEANQIMNMYPKIKAVVKLADWLSLIKTARFELKTGNETARDMIGIAITRVAKLLEEMSDCFGEAFISDFKVVLTQLKD